MKNTITATLKNSTPIRVYFLDCHCEEVTTLTRFLEICDYCEKTNTHLETMNDLKGWTARDFFICLNEKEA